MAFYVSICLLAALAAVGETAQVDVFKIVWGTTVGLALVHWFAFRLSARLVGGGGFGREDAELAAAQLAGALAIAMIASVPVLLFPDSAELDVARMRLAALIAVAGFAVARASGAGMGKSAAYAVVILGTAVAIAYRQERPRRALKRRPARRITPRAPRARDVEASRVGDQVDPIHPHSTIANSNTARGWPQGAPTPHQERRPPGRAGRFGAFTTRLDPASRRGSNEVGYEAAKGKAPALHGIKRGTSSSNTPALGERGPSGDQAQ